MTRALSSLLSPVTPELFMERYWCREYLHIPGNCSSRADGILRAKDIDLFLQSEQLPAALLNVTMNGVAQPIETWSTFDKSARGEARLAVPERLFELYRSGATIIINRADRAIPRLSMACRLLAVELGLRVGANIYITPAKAQGFARHSDHHEVLVLLVSGAKTFLVYPEGEQAREVRLEAGDLLYMPQGLDHEAHTETGSSVHVTIGIRPIYGFDLIEELASAAKNKAQFRVPVPLRLASASALRNFEEQFRRDLLDLISQTSVPGLSEHRTRDLVNSQSNAWAGRFTDLLLAPAITLDTICAARPGLVPAFVEEAGGMVEVRSGGNLVTIPRFLRKACEDLLDGAPHSVREAGGLLADRGKIHFVRSLVEAGFIAIVSL